MLMPVYVCTYIMCLAQSVCLPAVYPPYKSIKHMCLKSACMSLKISECYNTVIMQIVRTYIYMLEYFHVQDWIATYVCACV